LGDLSFTVIDTAGLEYAERKSLSERMQAQTAAAMAQADAVLFLVDARAGATPVDRAFADLVRKSGKPTIVVANKSEGRAGAAGAFESYSLGLGEPVAVSAEHGEGLADLYDALRAALPDATGVPESEDTPMPPAADKPIRIAVVGRPNTGKSTLINRLLGEDRLLTGPEIGITRDAIAVDLVWRGQRLLIHDTAGLRRRSRIEAKLEKLSVADALNAIRFADVVIVLVDAETPFEEQDIRIADLVEREGRAVVIGLNKWDLIESEPGAMTRLRAEVDRLLPQIKGVPVVALSARTGNGIDRLMAAVLESHAVWNRRVATAALNRFLAQAVTAHPPPALRGRRLRLDYMTQPKARPPTFVLFCSRASALPETYRRYLVNGLREDFDLPGTPIRLTLRAKANPFANRKRRRR
ncbi:MAG TPA: ribosome biogenesis GTPase Der, partial [Xanthobacteraceae bacterium]|nr:ribosome biogenesis GTPase Der [Xanthobacteraceae bacterium]